MKSKLKILVFSFRRNLQLTAFFDSLRLHCKDEVEVSVYEKDCSKLNGSQFRKDMFSELRGYEYVMFCVDDTIFTHDFSLEYVVKQLEHLPDAIGFSLRLGLNTDYCYMKDKPQFIPSIRSNKGECFAYKWTAAEWDFAYPLEVSSSVYRVEDIYPILENEKFDNPTRLEVVLHRNRHRPRKDLLMCFDQSVAFSAPFNRVQKMFPGNRSQKYTAEFFEELYQGGSRIDVESYSGFVTNAAHQEVDLNLRGE